MTRLKAIARLREQRRTSAQTQNAGLAAWQSGRRLTAKSQRLGLVAEAVVRRHRRADAVSDVQATLDDFARERESLRLEIDLDRSAHLAKLVTAVNEMTAEFHAAGDDRKKASDAIAEDVKAFLVRRRAKRTALRTEQAAAFQTFRADLAEKTLRARCEDFR